MSNWHVFVRDPIDDQSVSHEFGMWLAKQDDGLFVFREGATHCELTWAAAGLITPDQLGRVWLLRMFCERFELFARRRSCEASGSWQMRIIGPADDLPDGQPVRPVGDPMSILLLGEHVGNGQFVGTPNRYRRAQLVYPVASPLEQGETCRLTVQHFTLETGGADTQTESGALLSCWTSLRPDKAKRNGTSANDQS